MNCLSQQHLLRRVWCFGRMVRCIRFTLSCALLVFSLAVSSAAAQDQHARGVPMSEPIIGFVTATQPGHITLRDTKGEIYDVIPASRFQIYGKDGKPATLNDIHVGDGFNAQGILFGKTIRALQAKITDPEMQKMLFGQKPTTSVEAPPSHAVVIGKVSTIDNGKLTVTRSDGTSLIVNVDESTKFYRVGRDSGDRPSATHPHGADIALADLKVGDMVSIAGVTKDTAFTAAVVTLLKM